MAVPTSSGGSASARSSVAAAPSFVGVGDLPGGIFHSEVLAISDDGRVVVGRSSSARSSEEGFYKVANDTLTPLLGPGGTPVTSEPRALSPTGLVIAGKIVVGSLQAARWIAGTGWVALGDIPGGELASQALAISADGSVLVGWGASPAGYEAARWVNGNVVAMGDLPGGAHHSSSALVSADGGIVVGTGYSAAGAEVFRWSTGSGMVSLGEIAGGEHYGEPFGMTPDASVIVGKAGTGSGTEAFRWTAVSGFVPLGDLPSGSFESIALDVSATGATVVGYGTTANGPEAFVWDASFGMRRLKDVLLSSGLSAVADWTLTEATGISADGRVLVGNGTNPSGDTEGWIATLPAPLSVAPHRTALAIHSIVARAAGFEVALTLSADAVAHLSLFDATGRRLAEQVLGGGSGRRLISLAASGLPPGLYWVRLEQAGEQRVARATLLR